MSRPALLLIAYHFPPSNAIGGARLFRFYKYLKRLGYQCHVLTAAPQEAARDLGDVEYVADPLRVRPRQGFWWQAERVGINIFLHSELALGWSVNAWQAGRSFLDARKGQQIAILSSCPPLGTHLAAWRLARYSGRPWIADFRDPINSFAGERASLQDMVAPRLERSILNRADLVLSSTDSLRDVWVDRNPRLRDKIQVCWNGFDPEDVIQRYPLPARERKVLSHVGELYGGRDIRPLLAAIRRLIATERLSSVGIIMRQVGNVDPAWMPEQKFLSAAMAEGWLELKVEVPAAEARSLALDSDGLVLIQPHTTVQVPGKLFEYLRMGRPILAYVLPNSPIERILESSGIPYTCIYPQAAPEEMERKIIDFLRQLDGRPTAPSSWFEENFDASRQTAALDRTIQSLRGKVE